MDPHTSTVHGWRMEFEDPVYNHLRETYGKQMKEAWENAKIIPDASNTILLVERRPHPNIEFVLHNAVWASKEFPFSLTIVCSDVSEKGVREILGKHSDLVNVIPWFKGIGTRDEGRNEYNRTFLNPDFWKTINADYILSIQTDSYFLRPLTKDLWEYEYIACPWDWSQRLVGGGGLTWRKKDAVLRMLESFPKHPAVEGEDVYFSHACEALDIKVPGDEIRHELFVESTCYKSENPIGVHQWWTYTSSLPTKEQRDAIWNKMINISL